LYTEVRAVTYRPRKPSPQLQLLGGSGVLIVPKCSPFPLNSQIPPAAATQTLPDSSVFNPSGAPAFSDLQSANTLPFLSDPSAAISNTRTLRAPLSATYSFC